MGTDYVGQTSFSIYGSVKVIESDHIIVALDDFANIKLYLDDEELSETTIAKLELDKSYNFQGHFNHNHEKNIFSLHVYEIYDEEGVEL